ncbi:MAG: hypothetical protein ACYDBX_00170 [Patescibacteria group bacterium]
MADLGETFIHSETDDIEYGVPSFPRQDIEAPEIPVDKFETKQPNLVKILSVITYSTNKDTPTMDRQKQFRQGALSIYSDMQKLALDQGITLPQLSSFNFEKIINSDLLAIIQRFIQDGQVEGDVLHKFVGDIHHRHPHDFEYIKRKYPHNLYSPETLGALFIFSALKLDGEKDPYLKGGDNQDNPLTYNPLYYSSKKWKSTLVSKITKLHQEDTMTQADQAIIWNFLYLRLSTIEKYKGNIDEISKFIMKKLTKRRQEKHEDNRNFFDRIVRSTSKKNR